MDGEENEYHVLRDITKKDDQKKFYRKYVIIKVKDSSKIQKFKKMTDENLFQEHFLLGEMKDSILKEKSSFSLKSKYLKDESLENLI